MSLIFRVENNVLGKWLALSLHVFGELCLTAEVAEISYIGRNYLQSAYVRGNIDRIYIVCFTRTRNTLIIDVYCYWY